MLLSHRIPQLFKGLITHFLVLCHLIGALHLQCLVERQDSRKFDVEFGAVWWSDLRIVPEHLSRETDSRSHAQVELGLHGRKIAFLCDVGHVDGLTDHEILHSIAHIVISNLNSVL